jgi:GNAT superfamily N-acetyltransferase
MIKISKSTDKELKKFGEREWPIADKDHYGKNVNYNVKEQIYKATDSGEIVGSIKGKHETGVLYIDYLIVAHDKKRLGIGKALIQELETWGKKLGAHKAHLITGQG